MEELLTAETKNFQEYRSYNGFQSVFTIIYEMNSEKAKRPADG